MKKTMKTAMTAAMFTAAIGIGAGTTAPGGAQAVDTLPEDQLLAATAEEPQDVYGPPSWFGEETGTTNELVYATETPAYYGTTMPETTVSEELQLAGEPVISTEEELLIDGEVTMPVGTTTTVPMTMEALYGPPYVFFKKGDITMDDSVDARDLSVLKQALLEGKNVDWLNELGDVNGDGVFDADDIKELRRRLLGRSVEEEKAAQEAEEAEKGTSGTTTGTTTITTTTTTKEMITETLYGPPYDPIGTTVQPVYGPPVVDYQ